MGWAYRMQDWLAVPEHMRCHNYGSVLLLWNRQRGPSPVLVVDISEEAEARHDGGYPCYCLMHTQWYTLFKQQHSSVAHVRLCRQHAKEEHWIW